MAFASWYAVLTEGKPPTSIYFLGVVSIEIKWEINFPLRTVGFIRTIT